jgi:hypothetical protein
MTQQHLRDPEADPRARINVIDQSVGSTLKLVEYMGSPTVLFHWDPQRS